MKVKGKNILLPFIFWALIGILVCSKLTAQNGQIQYFRILCQISCVEACECLALSGEL